MDDLIAELNRTRRSTANADLRGSAAHVVELRRQLRAPVADVWDACTDPERVRRWFLPLSGDLRAGGTFQLEGNAGGTIAACEPPRRLELTWAFSDAEPSLVQLDLNPIDDDTTELVLKHTVPDDDHWAKFGPGAVGVGWDLTLVALTRQLSGNPVDASQFGAAVMRNSAASWGAAHKASGISQQVAREAATQTSNFYAPDQQPDG